MQVAAAHVSFWFLECGLYLDNRVFILVSKQKIIILTNQNQDKKANLRNK